MGLKFEFAFLITLEVFTLAFDTPFVRLIDFNALFNLPSIKLFKSEFPYIFDEECLPLSFFSEAVEDFLWIPFLLAFEYLFDDDNAVGYS